ncbi:hypothetical protein [Pseudomonas sp. EA_5y_Pfl2_R50]|uniref:hypothetical protein n=1 Tax=Pseudomonas sp. EA_5y_Pfl2_R50 TaxID=3088691 RepID=UPI0030DA1F6C
MNESDKPVTSWLEKIHHELKGNETDLSRNSTKSMKFHVREIHTLLRRLLRQTDQRADEQQSQVRWALAIIGLIALMLMANGNQSNPDISWIQSNLLALKIWGALLAMLFLSASLEQSTLWSALWTFTSIRWITYVSFTAMLLVASGKAAALVNSVFAVDATLLPITYAFTTAMTLFKFALPWLIGLSGFALIINIIVCTQMLWGFIKEGYVKNFSWQPLLFAVIICIFGFQVYGWRNNELSDERLTQKVYLIAQALDFNSRHDCVNIDKGNPVIFLGPTQQRVLVAPEAFTPFDFTTFFTAHVEVPAHFARVECEWKVPVQN